MMPLWTKSLNIWSINLKFWKVAGEFISPKNINSQFIKSLICVEHSLPFVTFLDVNVVVTPTNIHLGEDFCGRQHINQFSNEGEGITVFDHSVIEFVIILCGTELSVFLFDKEEGGGHGRGRRSDMSGFDVFCKEIV